ncbi:MAG: DUF5316 domain-containing protein [Bacillota bacterium]
MIKLFLASLSSALIFFLCGVWTGLEVFTYICGGIGLISILISGVLSGAFISGDQIRANTATENEQDRRKRLRLMYTFALLGAPHFAASIILLALES